MMDKQTRRLQIATMALELVYDHLPPHIQIPVGDMLEEIFEEWDAGTVVAAGLSEGDLEQMGSVPGLRRGAHAE